MQVSRRGRRTAIIFIASLTFIYATYVVATFTALRMGVLQSLTSDSKDFRLAATGGHSFWPTRIVLRDVRFRFKDYNIEMELEAQRATVRWSPLALFRKTIEIDEFRASGARYELLHRVKDEQRNRERLAAFPDTGFVRSKVYDSPKPPYRVPPFRIRVRHIRAEVQEAWLLEYRAVGKLEVTGGFELHEQVEVFPSHLRFRGARVFIGKGELASRLDCDVSARIDPFLGREKLSVALGAASGRVICQGSLEDLSALRVYLQRKDLLLDMGAEIDANLELDRGTIRSSTARGDVHVRRLGLADAFLTGDLRLLLGADSTGALVLSGDYGGRPQTGSLELNRARFELGVTQHSVFQTDLQHVQLDVDGLQIRVPSLLRRLGGSMDAPLSKIEEAKLRLDYQAPAPTKDGRLELTSEGAVAVFPRAGSSSSCAYEARMNCHLAENAAACPELMLACAPLALGLQGKQEGRVALRLQAREFEAKQGQVASEWDLSLGQPEEILKTLLPDSAWTDLGLALAPLGPVQGRAQVNYRAGTIAGTVEHLRTGPFSARVGFLFAESFISRWRVMTPLGRFGVHQRQSGVEITPFVSDDWDVLALEEQ